MVKKITPEAEDLLDEVESKLDELRETQKGTDGTPLKPGMIVRHGKGKRKIPYTMKDLRELFPMVTFIPEENVPVTYNGITVYLQADQEVTIPSCFKTVYDDHRRLDRLAARHPLRTGIGALEPAE